MHRFSRVAVSCAFFIAPFAADAANVIVDGREWRQLTDTQSVDQLYTVLANACDESGTGVCIGAYAGWTWASNNDVRGLFDSLIDPGTQNLADDYAAFANNTGDTDFDAAVGPARFHITYNAGSFDFVRGITRTLTSTGESYKPEIRNYTGASPFDDYISLAGTMAVDTTDTYNRGGAWMYVTEPTPTVPVPAALWLLGSGVGALGAFARRRKAGCEA